MVLPRLFATSVVFLALLIVAAGARPAFGATPQQSPDRNTTVDFERDVFPLFRRVCFECHGPKKQEADLRLDRRADALEYGVIEAGNPDDSELMSRIMLPRGHDEVMPPIGEPLRTEQVAVIRRWIEQGAEWPDGLETGRHWAYVAPRRPQLPTVSRNDWAKSPIDGFVLQRLEQEGLAPSLPATPEKLVRRVFLDLIGLPPTPAEVDAYVSDPSDKRFEQLVDELLMRPQFGERWARPWLDLARYADSHGFQRDNLRDSWAYRDWVIRAFNDDMPFDQFTIEQIAGDLLPNATESQRVATGFHRCAPTNVEAGSLPEETRVEQVIDRVNTTGAVWLGTTLECCQCHDHKFDPFTMKDYYRLLAFYNSTAMEADRTDPKKASSIQFQGPSMPLANPERDARRTDLQRKLVDVKQQQANRRKELAASLESWVSDLAQTLTNSPRTHVLDVTSFTSEGTTDTYEVLADGSVLLQGGDPPDTDVYQVQVRTQLTGIRAFRLDALQHESLPGMGPGRGDPKRRNFVLNEFLVEMRQVDSTRDSNGNEATWVKQEFSSSRASFSQKKWDVAGASDNNPQSGWAIAPEFNQSHWATFILAEPLDVPEGTELRFTLTQQWGQARTIGCFRLSAITGNVDAESIPDGIVKIARQPTTQWSKKDRQTLLRLRVERDSQSRELGRVMAQLEKQIAQVAPDTTLVMVQLETPRTTTVFERGDYRMPGQTVSPGTPSTLHPISQSHLPQDAADRLALARWLVSPQNPLVARVTVNRHWAALFGQGIVTTVEDFGAKGEPPSHPELLDWLAVEFMENDWSMKKLLKAIVLSATYQQSSNITPALLERDDRNQLLARGPRFRLDAEMIRDNALAIAGLLDFKQSGPPIRPFQPAGIWKKVGGTAYSYNVSPGAEQYRRGIYVVLKRGSPYPSFVNFDATARLACTVKRSRTNTPLQALTLLNDPVYVEAAQALARRVVTEKGTEPLNAQLDYAFRLCTGRRPTDTERDTLRELFGWQKQAIEKRGVGSQMPDAISAAWRSVATVLLNMHETITKD